MFNVLRVGIITTSTLPRPCPIKILTAVCVVKFVTSDLMCVSSVVVYTLVFIGVGHVVVCCFQFSGV